MAIEGKSSCVVLFYKYFPTDKYHLIHAFPEFYEEHMYSFQKALCERLNLKGRVLLSREGINGTLSAKTSSSLEEYIETMEKLDVCETFGSPEESTFQTDDATATVLLFSDIDWKRSASTLDPFPDLKISIVKEIISTGGLVSVDDVVHNGGKHLSPHEFHHLLQTDPNCVLVDVRNTFEFDIGHFQNPSTGAKALNPEMVTFSHFDSNFCQPQADSLKDKTVLMYCTGGIRCEKASAMLKKRGVGNVSQLSGGIHRYLEEFGNDGYFKGRNFVFDQRVSMTPSECRKSTTNNNRVESGVEASVQSSVGQCLYCNTCFDKICGSRVCTVCRDLVLVCHSCQVTRNEYHCKRHEEWGTCYFTFLEGFEQRDLKQQRDGLLRLRDARYIPAKSHRNVRRTLARQVQKIENRLESLRQGHASVEIHPQRRCRTCMDPMFLCDGRCWGFWKSKQQRPPANEPMMEITVGSKVKPGPHWNILRLGDPQLRRMGTVVEVKEWASGNQDLDCVVVQWEGAVPASRKNTSLGQPQIYRWGVVAMNGQRMYDVQRVAADEGKVR